MKSYTQGLMVGMSIALLGLIFMGSTNYVKDTNNRFEMHMQMGGDPDKARGILLDTSTGETWYVSGMKKYKSSLH